jgi:hypothetical protein
MVTDKDLSGGEVRVVTWGGQVGRNPLFYRKFQFNNPISSFALPNCELLHMCGVLSQR